MNVKKLTMFFVLTAMTFAALPLAYAATPTLSISPSGGDTAQVTVNGDANATVNFFYNLGSTTGLQTRTLGTTNSSGYFSTAVSAATYGITSGLSVYTIVNGQQSNMMPWPASSGGTNTTGGTITLSQNNLTLAPGQNTSIALSGGSNTFFISNNSNSSAVSLVLSGTQLTATGVAAGSTTATICDQNTITNCVSLYATTSGSAATGTTGGSTISFSQNNVNVNSGSGTIIILMTGGSNYYIASNSNPSAISASVYGSSVNLSANGNGGANATLSICSSGTSSCGTLYVTANGGNGTPLPTATTTTSNSALSFSTSNPTLTIGQTLVVTISGGSGTYFISSNPNPGIVGATLSGTSLTLTAIATGSDTLTVCATGGGCSTLTATVSSGGSTSGILLSTTNPTLTVGQTLTVSISGGSGSYFISSSPSSIAQASVNGTTLTLSGLAAGTAPISVCATGGGCALLNANVTGNTPPATTAQTVTASAATPLNVSSLKSIIAQIQQLTNLLVQLEAQAIAQLEQLASGTTMSTNAASTSASYKFSSYLAPGSRGAEVTALQERLTAEGIYSGAINGVFGAATEQALKTYQTRHGVSPLGVVGPATRNILNGN